MTKSLFSFEDNRTRLNRGGRVFEEPTPIGTAFREADL